jgi:hypothetical protein
MLDAGKDAARSLYEDLVLSDEEKAKREAARTAAAKRKRRKWLAIGVGSVVGLLTVLWVLARFWPWILALSVLAGLGYVGYRRLRRRLRGGRAAAVEKPARAERVAAERERAPAEKARPAAERERKAPERERVRVAPEADVAAARRTAAAATAASNAEREREIDEELAALKRRVRE